MYKKIVLSIVIIFPLFFFLVGYPIQKNSLSTKSVMDVSQRCYHVGNEKEFITCLQNHARLGGIPLLKQTVHELDDLQPAFGILFIGVFVAQLLFLCFIV